MVRKNWDLVVVVILAALSGLIVLKDLPVAILNLALALLLPGYVFSIVLFAEIEFIARLLVSLSLSMTALILGGLLLNMTSLGLDQNTWTITLLMVTAAGVVLAWWRRASRTAGAPALTLPRANPWAILLLGLTLGFISLAVFIDQYSNSRINTSFSMLWADYDRSDPSLPLLVGVQNQEGAATAYNLVVEVNGSPYQKWDNISLANGQRFETKVQFAQPPSGTVLVLLYQTAAPDKVYRHVLVALPSGPSNN